MISFLSDIFFNGQVSELNAELSYSWEEVKAYREVVYSTYKGWKIACKIEITLIRRNIFFFLGGMLHRQ